MSHFATSTLLFAVTIIFTVASTLRAEVAEYEDKPAWEAHIGDYTTLDFTGFEWNTVITDQYASLGAIFTDGDDTISFGTGFPNDARGLNGNGDITVAFTWAQLWIAADFPGPLTFELYLDDEWLYTSSDFAGPGSGHFAGLISSSPFNKVILRDWMAGTAYIDDLHFGVPTPAAWCVIAVAGLGARRRRRH